ncbi:MAG: nucleoside-triphosphatase [Lachnospiraceae bacterium]
MSNMLFLEGLPGLGKSTMLLETAQKYTLLGSGFFSQRLNDSTGKTKAFQLVRYRQGMQSVMPYAGNERDIFFKYPKTAYQEVHMEVFDYIREIVGDYRGTDFLLLDEIGGMELKSKIFTSFLYEMLESGIPCIGVLKSKENHKHMAQHVEETKVTEDAYIALREALENRYGANILCAETRAELKTQKQVERFFQGIAGRVEVKR